MRALCVLFTLILCACGPRERVNPFDRDAPRAAIALSVADGTLLAEWSVASVAAQPLLEGAQWQLEVSFSCATSDASCSHVRTSVDPNSGRWTVKREWSAGAKSVTATLRATSRSGKSVDVAAGQYSGSDFDGDGVSAGDCNDGNSTVGTCDPNADCTGSGPRRCECKQWYVGDGSACTAKTGPCAFKSAGFECRPAAGDCDVPEICDGVSDECPEDAIKPRNTTCRAAGGDCDVAEKCDGSSVVCPADVKRAASVECRPAAGICDVAEYCTGDSNTCPRDTLREAGTVCRAAAGVCDVEEKCTGTSGVCPSDLMALGGTVCRLSTGPCDVQEVCSGSVPGCPSDARRAANTVCRPAAGGCDLAEVCDGASEECALDVRIPAGGSCGSTVATGWGACIQTGTGCSTAGKKTRTTTTYTCSVSQICESNVVTEEQSCTLDVTSIACDDGNACTHTDRCTASGGCAGTTYSCDPAQRGWTCATAATCDGTGSCNYTYTPSGTTCRSATGVCDAVESCTGSSPSCPTDQYLGSTMTCRASTGACDAAETCSGTSSACPADGFAASGTTCSGGQCDSSGQCRPTPGSLVEHTISGQSFKFSYIPAGTFTMGSPTTDTESYNEERPQHQVTISKPFLMLRTEVTQAQWVAIKGSNPSSFTGDTSRPVEQVSWYDVVDFCNQLSSRDGFTAAYTINGTTVTLNTGATGYRLPTEAEWEYAARAGTTTPRYGTPDQIAWHGGNSGYATHPVEKKTANAWNLYDMLGNVWEWTQDWYGAYASGSQTDPQGPASGSSRVRRGGSWGDGAGLVRAAGHRGNDAPHYRYSSIGFRPLRSLP